MELDIDDDPVEWKTFHNRTREYVVFLLLFIFLYLTSYCLICQFKKRINFYSDCYEDAVVYRISLWMSTFSLSISIGAALLLPISIISNEILLLYPNSYYVQWLNSSLIQGLWNLVFLFSNLSLFILLPFAHLFIESEGFPGSSKGIMARVYEALLVLGLLGLLVMGITFIVSAIFGSGEYGIESAFTKSWDELLYDISSYYLPFLYSCVSFLGVLTLLLCTPFGFTRLFSVMTDLLMKNHKLSAQDIPPFIKKATIEDFLHDVPNVNMYEHQHFPDKANCPQYNLPRCDSKYAPDITGYKLSDLFHRRLAAKDVDDTVVDSSPYEIDYSEVSSEWQEFEGTCKTFSLSSFRKNCVYPFVMLLLLLLTSLSVLMVSQNTLELCFGIKSLPVYSQNLSLGISSLSSLGLFGAAIEIILILYLWCTSIVGLYSLPFFRYLKPKPRSTSMTQVIGNCAILLVLSSALPVLARSLGITNFDLLGDFGRINWLGNFYIVLFHNIVFAVTVAVCLGTKITGSVRHEIYTRLRTFSGTPFSWFCNAKRS